VSFSRNGTKSSTAVALAKKRRSANAVYEWVPTLVRKGPKLGHKVWSARLKKYVWARGISYVSWRLKLVRSQVLPKPLKGLDLPPNALDYRSTQISYYGATDGELVLKQKWNGGQRSVKGNLTGAIFPFQQGSFGPNPTEFTAIGPGDRLDGAESRANEIASNRLYEKAKRQYTNLAQALAERKQLSSMLVQIAKKILSFWLAIKRANFVAAARQLFPDGAKDIANVHLMYRYGIKPLISDLEGIVKAIKSPEDVYYEIVTQRKEKLERTLVFDQRTTVGGITARTRVYHWGEVKVVYKYRVRIASGYDALERTLVSLGFGNLNSLAYELTPFSFVVDWFIPIGNYLNNRDAFSGLSLDVATKTVLRKEYFQFEREFVDEPLDPNFQLLSPCMAGFVSERFSCKRTLMSAPPPLPNPDFTDTMAAIKRNAFTALALIIQLKR
jgi:hypothetical protein